MDNHKLFVGNMAARITQRDLWQYFSQYGVIDECAKFHESYAFVRFANANDAKRARQETHGAILKGRKLKVEFAANVNQKHSLSSSSSSNSRQKYPYVEPLRRRVNTTKYYSPIKSSPTISDNRKTTNNRTFYTNTLNTGEFLTPDLLRLAGIQVSSPDDGYETNSSPVLNSSNCDSRFFPISKHEHHTYANVSASSDYGNRRNMNINLFSLDFAPIRLFSDVSSSFGDD